MRLADAIWKRLAREVDAVFFVPGGGAAFLVDALAGSGLRAVSMMTEQGAGYAAVGYAMHHGLGVCLVTSGPGATNAITPCAGAWTDSVPVIFISGQAKSTTLSKGQLRTKGVQEINILAMAKPITKLCTQIAPLYWELQLNDAIYLCRNKRPGPCWLDVPLDYQAEDVSPCLNL